MTFALTRQPSSITAQSEKFHKTAAAKKSSSTISSETASLSSLNSQPGSLAADDNKIDAITRIVPPSERYNHSHDGDWQLGRVLGQGNFGQVIQAQHVRTRHIVALKRLDKTRRSRLRNHNNNNNSGRVWELLQREIQIHQCVDHPNILSFWGHYSSATQVTLVLDYSPMGDLFDYSHETCHCQADRLELFQQVFPQIVGAVAYLEGLQIAHRDIKPENILMMTNGRHQSSLQAKLCDFGWSVWYLKAGSHHSTLCGTPEYVPPELLDTPRRYAAEYVDPWALGVLGLEILLGKTPFAAPVMTEQTRPAIYANIRAFTSLDKGLLDWTQSRVKMCTVQNSSCQHLSSIACLIDDLMQTVPTRRLLARECLERHAHLLGSEDRNGHLSTMLSVKQRLHLFQGNQKSNVASVFL